MKQQSIQPLRDYVIIKPAPSEEISSGGIYIPSTAKEKPSKGEIMATGIGTKDAPMTVKVKDTVLYSKNAGIPIEMGNDKCLIMREMDVMAII